MASACPAPLRPQYPVTVPVGGDANKKRVLSGSPRPPPDVPMCGVEAEAIVHQLSLEAATAFNPADVVSDLSSSVSSGLGCTAGSAIGSLHPVPNPRTPDSIGTRQEAPGHPRYNPQRQSQSRPRPASCLLCPEHGFRCSKRLPDVRPDSRRRSTPETATKPKPQTQSPTPTNRSCYSRRPRQCPKQEVYAYSSCSLPRPAPGLLAGPAQTLCPPWVPAKNPEWPHAPPNTSGPPGESTARKEAPSGSGHLHRHHQ